MRSWRDRDVEDCLSERTQPYHIYICLQTAISATSAIHIKSLALIIDVADGYWDMPAHMTLYQIKGLRGPFSIVRLFLQG